MKYKLHNLRYPPTPSKRISWGYYPLWLVGWFVGELAAVSFLEMYNLLFFSFTCMDIGQITLAYHIFNPKDNNYQIGMLHRFYLQLKLSCVLIQISRQNFIFQTKSLRRLWNYISNIIEFSYWRERNI